MRKIQNLKVKIIATLLYAAVIAVGWFTSGIKCIFALVLGIPCPFCGMTRAFVSALKFDFVSAFGFHFMFWSLPVLYLLFLYDGKIFKNKHINITVWSLLLIGFLANWIVHIII